MELIIDIDVKITACHEVHGHTGTVTMLPFTGTAQGPYFSGGIIGCGVDTQKTDRDGVCRLSARYMLEGTDCSGDKCRIFIENNSDGSGGFSPKIITDSRTLSHWETSTLKAEILPADGGVNVKIYIL